MKIIVTGGTSFIGSHFLKLALKSGHEVVALRRSGSTPRIPLPQEPRWLESPASPFTLPPSDLHDAVLVHLAAHGVSPQTCTWEEAFRFNVTESLSLFTRALEAGVRRFVICGSCVEYGKSAERYEAVPPDAPLEPVGSYAASKAAQSIAAAALGRESHSEFVILRPFTVFGEGQNASNFWPSLRKAALSDEDFPMTPGEQIRDFIPVENVANAFLSACLRDDLLPGRPVVENIGTGHPQSLRDFAGFWWKHWNASGKLLVGALSYRPKEVMRYVPLIETPNSCGSI